MIQIGHTLCLQAGIDWFGDVVNRERIAPGTLIRADRRSVEIELASARRIVRRRCELRELVQEIGELVPGLGRIDEVCRDRGVELKSGQVDTEFEQRPHDRLHVVAANTSMLLEGSADLI